MKNTEELAAELEQRMSATVPGIICVAQEWDKRIDCLVRLPDGSTVGEMIALADLTDERIQQTADRLRRWKAGEHVSLVDEISAATRISKSP